MGCKLDFEWLSDPLLQYALYLSGFFLVGIGCCMVLIAHKFKSYRSHLAKQTNAIELINAVMQLNKSDSTIINDLNVYIQNHPIDCCYGLVRVFENSANPPDPKRLEPINISFAIDECLRSFFHKNRAVAIEAIGLLKLYSYRSNVLANLDCSEYCPFAAEALIRLDGKASIPRILDCYQNHFLTISETLTAFLQLEETDIRYLQEANSSIKIPPEFLRYLRTS